MVHPVETQSDGFLLVQVRIHLAQITSLHHLFQHHIAAFPATFRFAHGVEVRRIFAHAYQGGRFGHRQVLGLFIKIGACRGFDAHGIVEEIKIIEIHRDDFLLRVISLQLHGNHPLYRLLQSTFHRALRHIRVELLCQLLRNRAASPCIALP